MRLRVVFASVFSDPHRSRSAGLIRTLCCGILLKWVRCSLDTRRAHVHVYMWRQSVGRTVLRTGFTHWFDLLNHWHQHSILTPSPPKMKHVQVAFLIYFCIKKGTIYITFIKSFSIIKYNITLLQKFQIPATIQDKLPIRVHTVSFFHFNFFFHFFF